MSVNEIVTSFSIGLLATTSPCVLPLYPGFLAYISGGQSNLKNKVGRYILGFLVLGGVLTMMLVIGVFLASLSISLGRAFSVIIPAADLLIFGLGILLLIDINPFKRLPQIQVPVLSNPYVNAYIYGFLYGPIALPCSGPLIVGIFALSFTTGEALGRLSAFLWFGLGFGVPLLVLSFLSGANQRWITRQFALHSRLINVVGGLLLIGIAIYDFSSNWTLLSSFY